MYKKIKTTLNGKTNLKPKINSYYINVTNQLMIKGIISVSFIKSSLNQFSQTSSIFKTWVDSTLVKYLQPFSPSVTRSIFNLSCHRVMTTSSFSGSPCVRKCTSSSLTYIGNDQLFCTIEKNASFESRESAYSIDLLTITNGPSLNKRI